MFGGYKLSLGWGSISGWDFPSAGVVHLFEVSLAPPDVLDNQQAPTFSMVTLQFVAIADTGSLPVDFQSGILSDANGFDLPFSTTGGSIVIVPEPASLTMIAAGLVVLLRECGK